MVSEVAAPGIGEAANRPLTGEASAVPAKMRPAIPALTGLRFFAAFFVVVGHAQTAFITFSPPPALLLFYVSALISIGMSLFFVLSGFVIHYNYGDLLRVPNARNLATFYIARFARLYPLFLFFVVLDIGYLWRTAALPAVPFYLGLAQTWAYVLIDGRSLITHLRYADITWSVSTEWFFYCCYPAIAWIIFGRRTGRSGTKLLVVLTLLYMALVATAYFCQDEIDGFAELQWGSAAANNDDVSFFAWLVWYSPGRIYEFLGGVLAARFFIAWQHRPVGRREQWVGAGVLSAAIACLCLVQSASVSQDWRMLARVGSPFVVSLATGAVLFCCARYRSLLARALSTPWLIICGEASYSIYLFHTPLLQSMSPGVLPLQAAFETYAAVRFILTVTLLIVASIGFYRAFERPARLWIRKSLGARADRSVAVDWTIISLCVGLPAAMAIIGWLISFGAFG